MTRYDERVQEAGAAEEAESPRWVPRTRVVAEAVVAAIPGEGEAVAEEEGPWQPRTRVIADAVVAAIPAEGEAEPGGGADDESRGGA